MADFYTEMQAMARDLLAPTSAGGLGQGSIVLTRRTRIPPTNSWDDPTWQTESDTLRGAVSGVSKDLIGSPAGEPDGPVIVASDRQAICAVPAMAYEPGMVLSIDGKPVTVLRVDNIPAAGTPAAVRFIVR